MYEDIFTQIRNEAKKRNLKENTINAYCNSVDYFLRTVNKDVSALTTDDVNAFLTEKRLGGLAPRTYNHYHSSIRFFYKRILKMNWEDEDIPRMKLDYSLPTVLSRDPILFNKETNELLSQADSFRDEINALKNAVSGDVTKVTAATALLHFTEKGGILHDFDDDLFEEYVNRIIVRSRNEVYFELKCGLKLRERM